ncbi:right-handed parallel beta-helix repeat-containing protein [Micromonospora sp. 15K316]|uniref:right-handed parallel beta-helix repeat-containing protein n=1 Tax=Micromonospora sp. 15K316 TaxID=2530376 RepID=UPI00104476A8|nr:right-handed parallel beta-helix repeat-containing protein [Micromonospora sp. 15K316]TDC24826.1 right-handed parallel beta-helix repeat-containing protein [Micromonospora sp. 15K316]
MSNDVTTPDGGAPAPPPRSGRRKLWVAAGVAGLTGVVGLAVLGGVAARDDKSGGTDRLSDAQSSTPKQNVSDSGKVDAGDDESGKGDESRSGDDWGGDDWSGGDWSGQGDRTGGSSGREQKEQEHKDQEHKDQVKKVPCDTDKLIQAIVFANDNHGATLELAKDCTYNLTRYDEFGNGLPVITEKITLKGDKTKLVRNANATWFRILNVGAGGHLTVKGLTIKGGQTLGTGLVPQPMQVWSRYSNSVQATEAIKAGTPATVEADTLKAKAAAKPAAEAKPAAKPATDAKPAAKPAKAVTAVADPAPAAAAGTDVSVLVEEPEFNDGAGILVQPGGRADIEYSEIVQNQTGGKGGGLANFGHTRISKSTVTENTAFLYGGGLFNAGVLQVDESSVKNNEAGIGGGGIANGAPGILQDDVDGGALWLYKTEVTSNNTIGFGGGILDVEGDTKLEYAKITDNTAVLAGGGIATADSQLTLKHVTVAKNSTVGVGGGLAIAFDSVATIEESSIKENVAGFFGGGLFVEDSIVTLRKSEVVGNRAVGPLGVGGGIFTIFGSEVRLDETKVKDNIARLAVGGIFNSPSSEVELDDKSAVTGNRPTNCFNVPRCFA